MVYLIIIILIVGAVAYYLNTKGAITPRRKESKLRERCRVLLKMPPQEADQVIDRLVEREKNRNPGKTEEWYLDKVLYDLEKDYR